MNLSTYQTLASRTINDNLTADELLCMGAMGLAGECGEVCEPIKKHLFHGKTLDKQQVSAELGDVLWYVSALATALGLNLDDLAAQNIDKLKARWPNGFGAK